MADHSGWSVLSLHHASWSSQPLLSRGWGPVGVAAPPKNVRRDGLQLREMLTSCGLVALPFVCEPQVNLYIQDEKYKYEDPANWDALTLLVTDATADKCAPGALSQLRLEVARAPMQSAAVAATRGPAVPAPSTRPHATGWLLHAVPCRRKQTRELDWVVGVLGAQAFLAAGLSEVWGGRLVQAQVYGRYLQ